MAGIVATPASAVEASYYDTASVSSGWVSATTKIAGADNRWTVSVYLKDNKAGDDCTKASVWVVYYGYGGAAHSATQRVCGGGSTSFSWSGEIYRSFDEDARYVYTQVCQDRNWPLADACKVTQYRYAQ
jgi:hypothetical protein